MTNTTQKDTTVRNLNQKALVFYKQKKYNEAISVWQEALQKDPLDVTVLYSLGIVFFEKKEYKNAVVYLKKVTDVAPDHYKALLILGSAYLKLRQFETAEEYIKKSLSLKPGNKMAFLNLGAIYSVRREFDYAIQMFEETLRIDPSEIRAYLGLGKIYAFKGDYKKAQENFKRIIAINPNSSIATFAKKALLSTEASNVSPEDIEHYFADGFRYYLGNFLMEAANNYENYLNFRQKDDLAHYFFAETLMRMGELKKSFTEFKKAIFSNPSKGLYYKELAILLDKIGNPEDVIGVVKKAIESGKDDTVTFTLFGKNLIQLKQVKEAIPHLQEALKLDKNNILARYELAVAFIENGDFQEGHEQINTILKMRIKSPLKAKAEKLLNTLNQSYTIIKN